MKHIKRFLSNFIIIFFVTIIAINAMATILLFDSLQSLKNDYELLNDRIGIIEIDSLRESNISEQKILDFYKEISSKSENAINRILTMVGIVAGVVTFFSLLLAFKAPHDIDKQIAKLNASIDTTNASADEARYQALISSALARKTKYESIKEITSVIHKYPDKPDAFLTRGFLYDDLKKYDNAISDYAFANKRGCDKSVYYNSMGVAYSNKDEQKKAIQYFSKAISLDKENATYYCNRACSYDDIEQYEKALQDYDKAIAIDDEFYEAYYNRNFTYDKLWRKEKDDARREYYIQRRKEDLSKAISLNPEDDTARKHLKKFIEELIEKGYQPSQREMIAKIDEKIGDINQADNCLEAFEHYVSAYNNYSAELFVNNKQDHESDLERICSKIATLILNKNESIVFDFSKRKAPTLAERITNLACQLYTEGEKTSAELLFLEVLPNPVAALNLAYMRRRKETINVEQTTCELLEMSCDKTAAIWHINMALCYIDGEKGTNEWERAIDIVGEAENGFEDAEIWWSNIDVVGEKESNVVLLLLTLIHKYSGEKTLEEMIKRAEMDGYVFPDRTKGCPTLV